MGKLVAGKLDLEVEVSGSQINKRAPGFGWVISDETTRTLYEIDKNRRAAEQLSRNMLVG